MLKKIDHDINEGTKELNQNLPRIPDQPYKQLIIGGSGSGKT